MQMNYIDTLSQKQVSASIVTQTKVVLHFEEPLQNPSLPKLRLVKLCSPVVWEFVCCHCSLELAIEMDVLRQCASPLPEDLHRGFVVVVHVDGNVNLFLPMGMSFSLVALTRIGQ